MSSRLPVVFIIDDDPTVRKALARLMRSAGMEVSLHASAQDYLGAYDPEAPGCIVLDLGMPGLDGLALQDVLKERGGAPPIVFLSGQADVSAGVLAMKHGASDFLCKPVDDHILIDAVRNAFTRDRADRLDRIEIAELRTRLAKLTPRESQVLRHLVAGSANKVIAAELGTVEKTIKVHRARVMEKLQVRSLATLVQITLRAAVD